MDVRTILVLDIFKVHFEGCKWVAENAIGMDVCRQLECVSWKRQRGELAASTTSVALFVRSAATGSNGTEHCMMWGLSMSE